MAIDKTHPALTIVPQPIPFHLHQYPAAAQLPPWTSSHPSTSFLSITRTDEELSIVYANSQQYEDEAMYEGPWRCLKVAGPMHLSLTGILNALTGPLKAARVPIFALSTWNTDYVLIPWDKTAEAVSALSGDGWSVGKVDG